MTASPAAAESATPLDSIEVRERLKEALRLDLVGPWHGHRLERERIPNYNGRIRPSNWYLTGFIVPPDTTPPPAAEAEATDDLDEVPDRSGLAEESDDDGKLARRGYFPASIGLSFLIDAKTRTIDVTVRWGDYVPEEIGNRKVWSRLPHEVPMPVPVPMDDQKQSHPVPQSNGLLLYVVARSICPGTPGSEASAVRTVSVFLANSRRQELGKQVEPDCLFAFQPEIEVRSELPFPSKSMARSAGSGDWDDEVADLHYSDTPEYATGHGISVDWDVDEGRCRALRTRWIGEARVETTSTASEDVGQLSMRVLGELADGAAVKAQLTPLVSSYRDWIDDQRSRIEQLDERHRGTAEELLRLAGIVAKRIEDGIRVLSSNPDALDAFRVSNRAVARALARRIGIEDPEWRAFQLAFILLTIPDLVDPAGLHRETVDLLFFPTGGGKTEAYLGLAAFAMVLRRLKHPGAQAREGAGVSVIMRYTLRLLTLDQLARACGLVCAMELEREADTGRYGAWPFEIGLWVGTAATPNKMGAKGDGNPSTARTKVNRFKSNPHNNPPPLPLEECPWCRAKFEPDSFTLEPNGDTPDNLRVSCLDFECDFAGERTLPIVSIDEPLYRRLPAFLVATVDKFASLPWTGESGALFGGSDRFTSKGFYGPCDPSIGWALKNPLPPPDLIIQDELHLIAGPLGTMAGLYETVIEALCIDRSGNEPIRPKIIASTATVRRAQTQIQALFGRPHTLIFPPPGPDRRDSFFARTVPETESAARMYLGVSAQGRSAKLVSRRVWVALIGAATRAYLDAGGDGAEENPADPYMTVLGYFNSLRELGGGRRIVEEQVQNTIRRIGDRKRHDERRGLFRDRSKFSEVMELTSRVTTDKVAEARRLLGNPYRLKSPDGRRSVDFAIATNMISVGLDITRLGLMTVMGQPKTTAEYIQATSRVGRDSDRPGIVVTLLNMHKPRDRSHYEGFRHFHETFYRAVEVASVTPFAARAMDRGFAGALVSLVRQAMAVTTPFDGAARISEARARAEVLLRDVFESRIRRQPDVGEEEMKMQLESARNRIVHLLDCWCKTASNSAETGHTLRYQKYERKRPGPVLLRDMMETNIQPECLGEFRTNRSLRDVEPEVELTVIES